MKLLRVHILSAKTCGGLLDGLNIYLRDFPENLESNFLPLCLIGQNGAGKSQFLQVISEIFQSIYSKTHSSEERVESNPDLLFEIEYLVWSGKSDKEQKVRVRRTEKKSKLTIEILADDKWTNVDLTSEKINDLLPHKVVGYTSGENETLSLPFIVSRGGYAKEVAETALSTNSLERNKEIPDTRLMMIDYATHLEVLVANLLLGTDEQVEYLLKDARLKKLDSFRCIIQLAHSAVPKAPKNIEDFTKRKGIQLTPELEQYIEQLKKSSTCYSYEPKNEAYVFDFWVNEATKEAFKYFWLNALNLYSALHKLGMLNDLAIPKQTRERFRRETIARRFASRLPEPQDEDKVFRFERVSFIPQIGETAVDYVSLSDGEHQLGQILGIFCMLSFPNVLFLLDEPESHFNPQWRTKFITRILQLPTVNGAREKGEESSHQDCILTTHSPFVPSDMQRERVFIFSRESESNSLEIKRPNIETYGSTFDTILEECFDVRPPISQVAKDDIDSLFESKDAEEVKKGIERIGDSVEKAYLANHLRELTKMGE